MRQLLFALCLPIAGLCLSAGSCATTGPTDVNSAVASALSVARSGVDAAANAFDGALYGLDAAMDLPASFPGHITPGSAQAKQIAAIGRKVQAAINKADSALQLGNSAGAKAAIDEANGLISQFKTLLPHKATTGLVVPSAPIDRAAVLQRAAAA